jgi:uncharacterized protein YbjT (DUF2867 family)
MTVVGVERGERSVTAGAHAENDVGTIMVVGATGTVGREVLRRLTETGARPLALVRPGRDEQLAEAGIDYVTADLDRPDTIDAALDGVDRLFLLTRQTGRQLAQEQAVIAAAARAGIGRVVKLSVFRADETSPLQIARQHRRAERALQDSGLQHTVLRPVFFMQNLFAMVRDGTIATATGDGQVAMIDARDIAAAAVAALTTVPARGRVYTLTGPDAVSFDQVAQVIGRQTGRAVRHLRVPGEAVSERLRTLGAEPWFAADMGLLHRMLADGYEDVLTSDLSSLTGVAATAFDRFVSDFSARFALDPAAPPSPQTREETER